MAGNFRKILFWTHLVCGLVAGLGILTMSMTGVLLTYERQIKNLAARSAYVPASQQLERLSLEHLQGQALVLNPAVANGSVVIKAAPGAPVVFRSGRRGGMHFNPYTGEPMPPAAPWLDEMFATITGLHRWFNFPAEHRAIPRAIIDISNLIFCFLIISGLYLWLPRILSWHLLRSRLWLRRGFATVHARNFAWHHVFGIWCAVPLLVLVLSGSLFSYRWTGSLVFALFGTERPVASANGGGQRDAGDVAAVPGNFLSLDEIFSRISMLEADWREIGIALPQAGQPAVRAIVDRGDGGQPQLRDTVVLDRRTGKLLEIQTFGSLPLNQRIRSINRFLHTGQYFGLAGQTIAGLVSGLAVLMVWTGISLAWRRLTKP